MAYSLLGGSKFHEVKYMKFYPEDQDHHISFRHKKLPPNFDLTVEKSKENKRSESLEAHSSTYKKCPIYVHTFDTHYNNEDDFILKKDKHKKTSSHKSVMEKLEEKYWANWKPDKNLLKILENHEQPQDMEITVIKSAPPDKRHKIKKSYDKINYPVGYKLHKNNSISQEIQTDDLPAPPKKEEAIQSEENKDVNPGGVLHDTKLLKHTDSLILSHTKQEKESKEERFEQPRCIRLYRKAGKTPKNFVRGGSYPLKSCMKKENNARGKLNRPGSPLIVSSYNKNRSNRR